MRTYGNLNEIISAFFDQTAEGPNRNSNGSVYWDDHKTLYSYGRHFPLVFKHRGGRYLFNGDKYSSSTGRHQKIAAGHRSNEDITISFSALQAAGLEYKNPQLDILDAEGDQQEFFDGATAGGIDFNEFDQESANRFIKSAPRGATVVYYTWKDKQGEKHQAPSYWHRPPTALIKLKAWTEKKAIYSDDPDHRWETVDHETTKHPVKYFILGMDEGSYFISQLPRAAKTIKAAYDILKPKPIQNAEGRGEQVQRQGEWFFYPIFEGKTARAIYKQLDASFNLTDASNRPGAAHTATRGGLLSQVAFLTAEKTAQHFKHALKHCKGGQIIVSGQIRHSEGDHAQLTLSTLKDCKIFAAHCNTALNSWSSSGDVD